eukprot:TRINITY_DN6584_c0_g1_i5.p1 TRINITY_DN6584_c0_g1~~TRINITY_DN6584_c0_g1_i5.p1  ORF type:complete len:446 (+),score=88.56 TRINITY_DN6584_c0_g1_i5:51-1388(+)
MLLAFWQRNVKFVIAGVPALLVFLLLPYDRLSRYAPFRHGDTERVGLAAFPSGPDGQAQIAACVLQVMEAAAFAGEGSLAIRAAQFTCVPDGDPAACTGLINGVLLSFAWVASLISGTVAECGKTIDPKALCASDILCTVASVPDLVASAAVADVACGEHDAMGFDMSPTTVRNGLKKDRESEAYEESADDEEAESNEDAVSSSSSVEDGNNDEDDEPALRGPEVAACVFDVMQASVNIGGVGLQLRKSLQNCANEDGMVAQPQDCSINMLNLFSALTSVVSYISLIVNDCPVATNFRAACTAAIASVVSAALQIGACVVASQKDCLPDTVGSPGQPTSMYASALPELRGAAKQRDNSTAKLAAQRPLLWSSSGHRHEPSSVHRDIQSLLRHAKTHNAADRQSYQHHRLPGAVQESLSWFATLRGRLLNYTAAHADGLANLWHNI